MPARPVLMNHRNLFSWSCSDTVAKPADRPDPPCPCAGAKSLAPSLGSARPLTSLNPEFTEETRRPEEEHYG